MGIFKSADKIVDGAVQRNDNFTKVELSKLENTKLLVKAGMSEKDARFKLQSLEISSTNWFVAGWRPFIGWVCGFYIIAFVVVVAFDYLTEDKLRVLTFFMAPIMAMMLGNMGLRSWEKKNKVEDNR